MKRTRLEKTIAGEFPDRIPVSLWRHFPGDDQRAADLAQSVLTYQAQFDWDFVTILPSPHYMVTGYGLQDEWVGDSHGKRKITHTPLERTLDWTQLRPQEPDRGDLAKQLQTIRIIGDGLKGQDTPYITAIYSPLTQALQLAGFNLLLQSLRTQPDRLHTGLNILTETTLRFIDTLRRNTQIAGVLYITDMASFSILSELEYQTFGSPYDQKITEVFPKDWWFNMIQINGINPMIHLFAQYPIQALNWSDQETIPTIDRAQLVFGGAFGGGLGENIHLNLGTPTTIKEMARKTIDAMARRRMILCSGHVVPITAPISNLRAAREVVETSMR